MDDLDRASLYEEQARQAAIEDAKRKTGPMLKATGRCHYCEGFVSRDERFCDIECRDAWEMNKAAEWRRTGRL